MSWKRELHAARSSQEQPVKTRPLPKETSKQLQNQTSTGETHITAGRFQTVFHR